MRRIIRAVALIGAAVVSPLFIYLLAALILGLLPVNRHFVSPASGIDIYIRVNAVHADILLPTRTVARDWQAAVPIPGIDRAPYVAFGWGDRAFYLETREWTDLRAGNAARAVFGLDGAVMHLSSEPLPTEADDVVRIRITPDQLASLIADIDASFAHDAGGQPQRIVGAHYGDNDAFYEATGRYSMFSTCNGWVRTVLARAGIRTAAWSPFSAGLIYQLRQISRQAPAQ